ncbi:hypothetical protein BLOT_006843 [Blomia tropicalis]|nr:hypothetical protein BLOT_006843 [Blomia tropicalis]
MKILTNWIEGNSWIGNFSITNLGFDNCSKTKTKKKMDKELKCGQNGKTLLSSEGNATTSR